MGWALLEVNSSEATTQLRAGLYLFPANSIYWSGDGGTSWSLHANVTDQNFKSIDSFFAQTFTPFLVKGGVLVHITRNGVDPSDDQVDGSQVWTSRDGGRSWQCASNAVDGWCTDHPCSIQNKPDSVVTPTTYPQCDNSSISFGQPGTMYPHINRLRDGRLLTTYTQRCNGASPYNRHAPPSTYNAPACGQVKDGYGTGLRAALTPEVAGGISFNLTRDVIVVKAQNDWYDVWKARGCGCGYGNTIELADHTLVSVSCYMNATEVNATNGTFSSHLEVVRWQLPESNSH
eukprot:m.478672 g.478672  ORF g.478672 m.478672 type:complete len:289 (-) comp47276_c0_seq1:47-913(-)